MRLRISPVLVVLWLLGSASSPAETRSRRLAVLPLDTRNSGGHLTKEAQASLEELLRDTATNALAARGWTVLTQEATLQGLTSQDTTPEKCFTDECHLAVAHALNAEQFLSGVLQFSDGEFTASFRLTDTATARILASERVAGPTAKTLRDSFEPKALAFFTRAGVVEAAPPPVAVAPAAQGRLKVVSTPSGARVLIDGEVQAGVTPFRKALAAGNYTVTLELDGFTSASRSVTVTARKEELYSERLLKAAGWIEIAVSPPEARVTVDRHVSTSGKQGPFVVGRHTVRAEAPGYVAEEQVVMVEKDATALASLTLAGQPGKLLIKVNVSATCEAAGQQVSVIPGRVGSLSAPAGSMTVVCRATGYREALAETLLPAGRSSVVEVALVKDERPQPGQLRREPRSGVDFAYVPAGVFRLGCEEEDYGCEDNEKHSGDQKIGAFWLSRTEITVEAYRKCLQTGACPGDAGTVNVPDLKDDARQKRSASCNLMQTGREQHPMNCVDWNQARAFCEWLGGRLPTAPEWEYAAKGGEHRIFPWGNDAPSGKRANFGDRKYKEAHPDSDAIEFADDGWGETAPVGSFPSGGTKWGVQDMAGNVWEWTDSAFSAKSKETRGGSWTSFVVHLLRASMREPRQPLDRTEDVGFRCALPAGE